MEWAKLGETCRNLPKDRFPQINGMYAHGSGFRGVMPVNGVDKTCRNLAVSSWEWVQGVKPVNGWSGQNLVKLAETYRKTDFSQINAM